MADIRIGVSGWSYRQWEGRFFPDALPRKAKLEYTGRQFNSVEINGSFYSLLTPAAYERYRAQTPAGFVFAVKGSQFITHSKKLKDVRVPLANFLASGVLRLEEKLGPILWQFPQRQFDHERLERFLELLPYDTAAASRLARRHDARVSGRASTAAGGRRPVRHAIEFRHEGFFTDAVVRLLRRYGVALVVSHGGTWPYAEEVTAGFVYLRLHGAPQTYRSAYGRTGIAYWAERVRQWAAGREPADAARLSTRALPRRAGRDVYVYFDNDQEANAPRDARRLMAQLRVEP